MRKNIIASILFGAIIISLTTVTSCKKNKKGSCNGKNTRRSIKIGTDEDANKIDLNPIVISVKEIGDLSVGEADSDTKRQAIEKKVYKITAKVHKLSKHRDGDWKVKLTNGNDKFVNCESPNPGCKHIGSSVYLPQYKNVRVWIEKNKDDLKGKTVTITGIGFIDIDHKYPRNAADNELEIHPILSISY